VTRAGQYLGVRDEPIQPETDFHSHMARMLRGDPYRANDPQLLADHERCRLLVEAFNATSVVERDTRRALLHELFGAVGERVEVRPPFQCDYGFNISCGDRTFVNYGAVFLDVVSISVGADVQIGTSVQLLTATHPLDAATRRQGWESGSPITVGDGVWLGSGVIVCPGVSIGEDTVVGAGSVVTADLPPSVLAVGNPAQIVRPL
jgi:maltose O-acetyltransferase